MILCLLSEGPRTGLCGRAPGRLAWGAEACPHDTELQGASGVWRASWLSQPWGGGALGRGGDAA